MYKRELQEVEAQEGADAAREFARARASEVHGEFSPWATAGRAVLHAVIRPEDTRQALVDGLFIARSDIVG
jgi:acetyl-CoA carboxylase carboxyltransferase component